MYMFLYMYFIRNIEYGSTCTYTMQVTLLLNPDKLQKNVWKVSQDRLPVKSNGMFAELTAHVLWAVKQITIAIGLSINYMYVTH